jgi:hypothetical protein
MSRCFRDEDRTTGGNILSKFPVGYYVAARFLTIIS